mgnify:CR=1 FL=1
MRIIRSHILLQILRTLIGLNHFFEYFTENSFIHNGIYLFISVILQDFLKGKKMNKKIYQLIITSIKENSDLVAQDLSSDTPIFGKDSNFDSLGLVTFLVDLEQRIEDEIGINIAIADERAISLKNSPFKTVGTLNDFLVERLEKNE